MSRLPTKKMRIFSAHIAVSLSNILKIKFAAENNIQLIVYKEE